MGRKRARACTRNELPLKVKLTVSARGTVKIPHVCTVIRIAALCGDVFRAPAPSPETISWNCSCRFAATVVVSNDRVFLRPCRIRPADCKVSFSRPPVRHYSSPREGRRYKGGVLWKHESWPRRRSLFIRNKMEEKKAAAILNAPYESLTV